MEITNRRFQFTVKNTVNGHILYGEVSKNEEGLITSFSGNVKDDNDAYVGDFYYNEREDTSINKSVNNVKPEFLEIVEGIIQETVNQIKNDNE